MGNAARCRDARNEADEDDGEVGVGDGHLDLVENSSVLKDSEGVDKGSVSLSSQTGCPGDHVLFGDTHREIAVGVIRSEFLYFTGSAEVCGKDDHFGVFRSKTENILFVCVDFNFHLVSPSYISS